jgi:hypothetical protein
MGQTGLWSPTWKSERSQGNPNHGGVCSKSNAPGYPEPGHLSGVLPRVGRGGVSYRLAELGRHRGDPKRNYRQGGRRCEQQPQTSDAPATPACLRASLQTGEVDARG